MDSSTPRNYDGVTAVVVTNLAFAAAVEQIAAIPCPTIVVVHNADPAPVSSLPPICMTLSYEGPFSWSNLANMGACCASAPWLLFLHDDVQGLTSDCLGEMLRVADESGAEAVVPCVAGDSRCARQSDASLSGWSHLTELATDCCLLIKQSVYSRLRGFPPTIDGQSFDIPFIQLLLFGEGHHIVVAHEARLSHAGAETLALTQNVEQRRHQVAKAVKWAARNLGYDLDYEQRLALPRLVRRDPGQAKLEALPGKLLIDGLRVTLSGHESEKQLLDVIANHAQHDEFEYRGKLYRRRASGDRFTVLREDSEFNFGIHYSIGLGDAFFMMKIFACLKERFPRCTINIYSELRFHVLWSRCPDVDGMRNMSQYKMERSGIDIHRFGAMGIEGVPANICGQLGVQYEGQVPKYVISDDDRRLAVELLLHAGRDGRPLMAVQVHGGWRAKQWRHTAQFARQAVRKGFQVCFVDSAIRARIPGAITMPESSLPVLVAMLDQCQCIVGFDSGPIHVAAAIGLPSVSLWGPIDPAPVLFDAHITDTVAIRKRNPWRDCGPGHCREIGYGADCPLKNGARGGLCMDEVTTHDVWSALTELLPLQAGA